MAHVEYHNAIVNVNDIFYDSHKLLIEKVTMELGHYDKYDELCIKFLDKPKIKCKTDKNAPRKAKNAFMLFCDVHRDKVMSDCKKMNDINKTKFNLGIVQKKLGEMWSEITDEEKQKYDSLCEEDKERYTTEYEAYQDKIYGGIYS